MPPNTFNFLVKNLYFSINAIEYLSDLYPQVNLPRANCIGQMYGIFCTHYLIDVSCHDRFEFVVSATGVKYEFTSTITKIALRWRFLNVFL